MKKRFTLLFLIITSLVISLHAEDYIISTGDGNKDDVTVTGSLNFYDNGGATGDCQSYYGKMVTFLASDPTKLLQIEMHSYNTGATGYMKLYNGDPDFINWNTSPDGEFGKYTTSDFSTVYTTVGPTLTIMSVTNSGSNPGWYAVITEISGKDMSFTSCTQSQDDIVDFGTGSTDVPLLKVTVITDGNNAPISLNELQWDLTGTTDLANIATLKLYKTTNSFTTTDLIASTNTITKTGTFTQDVILSPGTNNFWLAVDFATTAIPGTIFDASCPTIKVNNIVETCGTATPDGQITVLNETNLTTGPTTYTINAMPLYFYDDGGKNGEFTKAFEGQATFVPATPGNAVKIDFTSVDITDFGSTKDILQIYNGSTIDATQLISNIDTKQIIKSTSNDGALTLVFKSKAYYTRAGFAATITQFTPQNMVVKTTEITQVDAAKTLSSQEMNVPILCAHITTEFQKSPLQINEMHIDVKDFNQVKSVKVYSTGTSNEFTTTTLVGEANNLTANNFDIKFTNVTLTEGSNYYWIAYDMQDLIAEGTEIDGAITSAVLGILQYDLTNTGNPDGARTIANKITSGVGSFTYSVQGSWLFTHHANSDDSKYVRENGDQVTIFTPTTQGEILKLQFADFETKWYGATEAKFAIYSGQGDTKKLLWSVQSENDADNGPGADRVFRSGAADGSFTVIFNTDEPRTDYYCAAGWHATVSSYMPSDMTFQSMDITQATTNAVAVGSKDSEILGITIETLEDKNPFLFEELVINTKGTKDVVDSVKIYSTSGSTFNKATATLIGKSNVTTDIVTIALNANTYLSNGSNNYWVCYDINPLANAAVAIDANITSVKLSGDAKIPTDGNPIGERLTVKQYMLTSGDNGTVTVAGSLNFYDDGGKTGDYSKYQTSQVTFQPASPNKVIKMTVNTLDFGNRAELKFYFDNKVKEGDYSYDKQLNQFDTDLPIVVLTNALNGCMTVTFKSSYSLGAGFEILVEEYEPIALSTTTVSCTGTDFTTVKGDQQAIMQKIAVTVGGERGTFDFNSFKVSTATSTKDAISKAKLYYTGTSELFSNATLYAEAQNTNDALEFNGTLQVDKPTIYYFWLSYELANTLIVDNTAKAQLIAYTLNNQSEVIIADQPITTATVATGLSGDYTIGASTTANYATVSEAIAALEIGVEGAVRFLIEDGTYTGQHILPIIKGTSSVNTVTFCAASPASKAVLFKEEDTFKGGEGLFEMHGANYIILKDLQFETSLNWNSLLLIKDASQNVTIQNCSFTTTSASLTLLEVSAVSQTMQFNNNLTIQNCSFNNGLTGLEVTGNTKFDLESQQNLQISQCNFSNQRGESIKVILQKGLLIENNTVQLLESNHNMVGMMFSATAGAIVRNNTIHIDESLHTGYYKTVYAMNILPRLDSEISTLRTQIYNNHILVKNVKADRNLVYARDINLVDFVYNTIRVDGDAKSKCLLITNAKGDYSIQNNIIQHLNEGKVIQVNTQGDVDHGTFNNNIYYTNGAVFGYAINDLATFADWQTVTSDTNSQSSIVSFENEFSPKLISTTNLINAVALDYVTTDIMGIARLSNSTPGASQYKSETPTSTQDVQPSEWSLIGNHDGATILSLLDNYSITIYDMTGRIVNQRNNCDNNTSVKLNTGLYIVHMQTTTTQTTLKVLIP